MTRQKKVVASLTTDHGFQNTSDAYYSASTSNSTAAQRQAILDYLLQGNHMTTHWRTEPDVTGKEHRVAEYVLFSGGSE